MGFLSILSPGLFAVILLSFRVFDGGYCFLGPVAGVLTFDGYFLVAGFGLTTVFWSLGFGSFLSVVGYLGSLSPGFNDGLDPLSAVVNGLSTGFPPIGTFPSFLIRLVGLISTGVTGLITPGLGTPCTSVFAILLKSYLQPFHYWYHSLHLYYFSTVLQYLLIVYYHSLKLLSLLLVVVRMVVFVVLMSPFKISYLIYLLYNITII